MFKDLLNNSLKKYSNYEYVNNMMKKIFVVMVIVGILSGLVGISGIITGNVLYHIVALIGLSLAYIMSMDITNMVILYQSLKGGKRK